MQIACAELGIDTFADERPLTVTGGLTFAGGPGNNYVTHSIAAMAEKLRASGGETTGLVTVGRLVHDQARRRDLRRRAAGARRSRRSTCRPRSTPDRGARSRPATRARRVGEASTVIFDVAGTPTTGAVTALLADGRRTLAKTHDPAALDALTQAPVEGRALELRRRRRLRFRLTRCATLTARPCPCH